MINSPQDSSVVVQIVYAVDVAVLHKERLRVVINIVDHLIGVVVGCCEGL